MQSSSTGRPDSPDMAGGRTTTTVNSAARPGLRCSLRPCARARPMPRACLSRSWFDRTLRRPTTDACACAWRRRRRCGARGAFGASGVRDKLARRARAVPRGVSEVRHGAAPTGGRVRCHLAVLASCQGSNGRIEVTLNYHRSNKQDGMDVMGIVQACATPGPPPIRPCSRENNLVQLVC